MDSTFVHQIPGLISNLGGQARWVLVWYLVTKLGVQLVWAGVALFLIVRASNLASSIGRGQALLRIIGGGSVWGISNENYAKAQRALLDLFKGRD